MSSNLTFSEGKQPEVNQSLQAEFDASNQSKANSDSGAGSAEEDAENKILTMVKNKIKTSIKMIHSPRLFMR